VSPQFALPGDTLDAQTCKEVRVSDPEITAFIESALATTAEACVLWPFSRDPQGYGRVQDDSLKMHKYTYAHRYVCKLAHGPAPEGRPLAAHFCNVRECVHPAHLCWSSYVENTIDRYIKKHPKKLYKLRSRNVMTVRLAQ
jgi:hypothetical protein